VKLKINSHATFNVDRLTGYEHYLLALLFGPFGWHILIIGYDTEKISMALAQS